MILAVALFFCSSQVHSFAGSVLSNVDFTNVSFSVASIDFSGAMLDGAMLEGV